MNYFKQYDRVIYDKFKYIIHEVLPSETLYIISPINFFKNPIIKAVSISDVELDKEYYREEKLKLLLDEV